MHSRYDLLHNLLYGQIFQAEFHVTIVSAGCYDGHGVDIHHVVTILVLAHRWNCFISNLVAVIVLFGGDAAEAVGHSKRIRRGVGNRIG